MRRASWQGVEERAVACLSNSARHDWVSQRPRVRQTPTAATGLCSASLLVGPSMGCRRGVGARLWSKSALQAIAGMRPLA